MNYIETAIEITQRQIEELKSTLPTLVTQEYYDSFNLAIEVKQKAIQALQEKAEREKGCEYCNSGTVEGACDSDGTMRVDKGDTHCLPYIAVNNETYGTSDLFDINYCPMCGRKLTSVPTDER